MPLYLGFDVRSESLTATAIAIGATRRVVFHRSINFDSPLMWEDALDRVMSELATAAELNFDDLRGISGSASDEELRAMRESPRSFFTQLLASSYWQRRYSVPRCGWSRGKRRTRQR